MTREFVRVGYRQGQSQFSYRSQCCRDRLYRGVRRSFLLLLSVCVAVVVLPCRHRPAGTRWPLKELLREGVILRTGATEMLQISLMGAQASRPQSACSNCSKRRCPTWPGRSFLGSQFSRPVRRRGNVGEWRKAPNNLPYHGLGCAPIHGCCSVITLNLASWAGPKLVDNATSAASRPRAISIRPIRG